MRTIKFRAWDNEKQKMIEWKSMKAWMMDSLEQDNIMQYTGLKDKNGVEIFEGDIVKYYANGDEIVDSVVYIESFFGVEKITGMLSSFYPIEVIGNIYKNPELLTN